MSAQHDSSPLFQACADIVRSHAALLQSAPVVSPPRPDRKHTLIEVVIGDESLTAECSITGRYHPAVTQADPEHCHPEEFPEVEIVRLWTADLAHDLSGLMEFGPLGERVQELVEAHVAEHDGPDPDEARERQMELVP